ncbi:MAG TPA: LacI family DNA-binding transcriptional regulator [Bacillus sp. (in: firmicutes)]|nr:LacI family DNA-binding transcriptional regulator [Bacillus sp. (in: firmicutes)]
MKTQAKVTAKLIAEQLGLSMATVDRALNNRGNVKEETYQRIMEKARELNYTPNKLASFLSKKKQYSIAVAFPEYPKYFWEQIEVGISKAFNELSDYGLKVETFRISDEDSSDGADLIKEIIDSKKFDALAIADGKSAFLDLIDYGIDQGIQVCTFNHDSPASKRLFYVGSDYRSAGRLAAELLCNFIGRSGKAALITTTETTYQAQEKIAGFREVLSEYSNVEMVGPLKMELHDVHHSLDKLRSSLDDTCGIYVSNAELSNVAKWLEHSNGKRKVLIGHDMNEEIYKYFEKGFITAAISQDPVSQGYLAVKKLFNQLAGEENMINKEIITKLEVITKENAKFYL